MKVSAEEICFIICANNEKLYQNVQRFINKLVKPDGFEIKTIIVTGAKSIASAYNQAMRMSAAKYKVYLHQDVLIINSNFINDIIAIFAKYSQVGMLGVAGAQKLPGSGIWWQTAQLFGKVYDSPQGYIQLSTFNEVATDYLAVEAIDGLIMITQYDIGWREDIFDGWHFYDVSQSMEFRKAGYEIGVPKQITPWCIHDCGVCKMEGYEKYRQLFLKEYNSYL